jgi:hypothetical protein
MVFEESPEAPPLLRSGSLVASPAVGLRVPRTSRSKKITARDVI